MGNEIGLGLARSVVYVLLDFWKKIIYKNLHIEPSNYAMKRVCFDFCSTNGGSSVIGTGRSEGSLLPYFYWFQCHYPLITYLNSHYF